MRKHYGKVPIRMISPSRSQAFPRPPIPRGTALRTRMWMLLLPSRSRSRLKNTDTPSQGGAWQYALKLLAMRDYTLARLKAKLSSRDYDETDIEAALGRLEAEGWINDRRFAERFAESAV